MTLNIAISGIIVMGSFLIDNLPKLTSSSLEEESIGKDPGGDLSKEVVDVKPKFEGTSVLSLLIESCLNNEKLF